MGLYVQVIPNRTIETLHPIIQDRVRPGSIIHSDEWRAYTSIAERLNFAHETLNHKRNFINPHNNAHT